MQLYTYHFIANSASYLNAAGFWDGFSAPVISRIESLGGRVGGGGGWGAEGGLKHLFGLKERCYAFSKWHELIQSTRETQTAVRSSLVPHAIFLLTCLRTMKCTFVVHSICKKPSVKVDLAIYCLVLGVHEWAYHVQTKDGFQFLCLNGYI